MKNAILQAMRDQQTQISSIFNSINAADREQPMAPSFWRPTDLVTHLWAWQSVTTARVFAAVEKEQPEYPAWFRLGDEEVDETNLRIYENYKHWHWEEALSEWETNYLRLIDLGEHLSEKEFITDERFPWLNGHSVAAYYIASYDHHFEHMESLSVWMSQRGADGFMWI